MSEQPITDAESSAESPQSFDPELDEEPSAYLVAIEDLFRVKDADSPEEAEAIALKRFGEEGWKPHDASVVDTEP